MFDSFTFALNSFSIFNLLLPLEPLNKYVIDCSVCKVMLIYWLVVKGSKLVCFSHWFHWDRFTGGYNERTKVTLQWSHLLSKTDHRSFFINKWSKWTSEEIWSHKSLIEPASNIYHVNVLLKLMFLDRKQSTYCNLELHKYNHTFISI